MNDHYKENLLDELKMQFLRNAWNESVKGISLLE